MIRTVKTATFLGKEIVEKDGKATLEKFEITIPYGKDAQVSLKRELGAKRLSKIVIEEVKENPEKTFELSDEDFFKYATEIEPKKKEEKTN